MKKYIKPNTEILDVEVETLLNEASPGGIVFDEGGNTGSAIFGEGNATGDAFSKGHIDIWGDDE